MRPFIFIKHFCQIGFIALCGIYLSACATNPVTGSSDIVFLTEEQELEGLGEKIHPQILSTYGGEYKDPKLRNYVIEVGNRIAKSSHRQNLVYHFFVLDNPAVNAFATPGYIYITRGMLAYLASEAELAAILGHEMGHITARHSVRQHTHSTLAALLSNLVAHGTETKALSDLSQVLGTAIIRGYGRKHELEADRLGAEYLAKSGYQPDSMLNVLNILKSHEAFEKQLAKDQGREANTYHGLFATHPDNDLRLQEVIREANKYSRIANPKIGRQTYLEQIDGMVYGASGQHGTGRGNRLYRNDLKVVMTFPERWAIKANKQAVRAHNAQNTAVIFVSIEHKNKKETAQQLTQRHFKGANMKDGKYLQSALEGWTAVVDGVRTPYGIRRARIATVLTEYYVFKFLATTKKAAQFANTDALFLQTIEAIRPITKKESRLAQPRKIRIRQVNPNDTFAGLASNMNLSSYAEETLRLINGKYPQGSLTPGESIKIIQ